MKLIGSKGEDLAASFLKDKGYRIIARNYKTPVGEIDIIAEDRGTLVFIEVKTRSNNSFGYPFEAVDARKRQKLKNLALLYLKKQKRDCAVRFDVLSIYISEGKEDIEHIKDAFEV
ncbi:MAG: YraN family protein [Nitrospirae bacterium]|nr:YraN family protein [Nitrospirota bacterium]